MPAWAYSLDIYNKKHYKLGAKFERHGHLPGKGFKRGLTKTYTLGSIVENVGT